MSGEPSSSSISSALPWSATMTQAPPVPCPTGVDDAAEALVDGLDAFHGRLG